MDTKPLYHLTDAERGVLLREIALTCSLNPDNTTAEELSQAVMDLADKAFRYDSVSK